jgi:Zn-dependent peptidase ImmA (M78 family)
MISISRLIKPLSIHGRWGYLNERMCKTVSRNLFDYKDPFLLETQLTDNEKSIKDIASEYQITEGSIKYRLQKLGSLKVGDSDYKLFCINVTYFNEYGFC